MTFGSQGDMPYVPGVPVGSVVSVTGTPGSQTRSATVSPYVDFTSLDLVGVVVQPPRADPRDAVLPPRPADDADPDGHGHRDPEAGGLTVPPARVVLAVVLLTVALAVQVTLMSRLPLPGATPDLLLLVVVALALAHGPGFGLVCGFAAGLAADLVPPADHEVGRWALVLTLVGYLAGMARDQTRRSAFVPLVVVAVAGGRLGPRVRRGGRPDGRSERDLGRGAQPVAHRRCLRCGAERVRPSGGPRRGSPGRGGPGGLRVRRGGRESR